MSRSLVLRLCATALLLSAAVQAQVVQAQVVFQESMTNWAHAGTTGCTLYTAPLMNLAAVSVKNVSSLSFPLPSSSSLIGVKFFEQALVLDSKANKFGAALSGVGTALIQN